MRPTTTAILAALLVATALTGCRTTRYVPVETVRTEYCDRLTERVHTDTVAEKETVYISGDTVYVWRDRWRTRRDLVRDTVYVEHTDTVTQTIQTPAPLTRWQQVKQEAGGLALGAVAIALLIGAVALWRRFRKSR